MGVIHAKFAFEWVDFPDKFLPSKEELEELSDEDKFDRMVFFLYAMAFVYLGTLGVGTAVMFVGPKCKSWCKSLSAHSQSYNSLENPCVEQVVESQQVVDHRVKVHPAPVFFTQYAACLGMIGWSINHRSLSKLNGLDWEMYMFWLIGNCAWLLAQSAAVVCSVAPGTHFGPLAFAEASMSGTMPFLSDSFDTLKDAMFGGLCFQSNNVLLLSLGLISCIYTAAVHIYVFCDKDSTSELQAAYTSVLVAPSAPTEGTLEDVPILTKILAALYKQTIPGKQKVILMENSLQAVGAVLYSCVEGGSPFVIALNVFLPAAQWGFARLGNKPLGKQVETWLTNELSQAIIDDNEVKCDAVVATIAGDDELATIFAKVAKASLVPEMDFDTTEMDLDRITEEEFVALAGFKVSKCSSDREHAIGKALEVNTTWQKLDLSINETKNVAPFGKALEMNTTLKHLIVENNEIEDISPIGKALQMNTTLQTLELNGNKMKDISPIRKALEMNTTLQILERKAWDEIGFFS